MPPLPPPPQIYCYHYSIWVTTSEKSSTSDEVKAHTVTFLKIVSQNVPDCISADIHSKKFPGACSRTPKEARRLWPLGTSPPNDKSQIYVPSKIGEILSVEPGITCLTLKNSFCAGENLKKKRTLTLVTLASDSSSEEDWAVETLNGIWKTCSRI